MSQTIGTPQPTNIKQHYHLVTAELVFKPNDQEMINAVRMNGVIVDEEQGIPQRLLAKAQQIVQLNFHRKIEEESANVTVVDVILLNLTYLGHFTQEEFFKKPEGLRVAERKEPTLSAVPDLETAVADAGASANQEAQAE